MSQLSRIQNIQPGPADSRSVVHLTINGYGFTGATSISVSSGLAVVAGSFYVESDAQITAAVTLSSGPPTINQSIAVVGSNGTSDSFPLNIT
jgi:hypothetical protein